MLKAFSPKPRMIHTIAEMLLDRGYELVGCIKGKSMVRVTPGQTLSIEDVEEMLSSFKMSPPSQVHQVVLEGIVPKDSDRTSFVRHLDAGEKVVVYMTHGGSKLGKAGIIALLEDAIEKEASRIILPLVMGATVHVPKEIARVKASHGIITEIFLLIELFEVVGRHEMSSIYHVVEPEEVKKLLKDNHLENVYQLPQMKETDPQARYYGLTNGMVVKEHRPTLYYRVITPAVG